METIVGGHKDHTETSQSELDNTQTISVVQVAIPNQPVQVQSVIQANQPSVIQTAGGQHIQTIQVVTPVGSEGETSTEEDAENRKRRELLNRRPSYRKILNELSSEPTLAVAKIEEESNSSLNSQDSSEANEAATNLTTTVAGVQYHQSATGVHVVPAQAIQLAAHGDAASQGLQTLTMTNVNNTSASTQGATIVQYAQGPDGQFFIPGEALRRMTHSSGDSSQNSQFLEVSSIGGGTVQAYQISTPSSLPQGVVMATTGQQIASPQQVTEEASRKRELRLLKNSDAARECRRKKKEYVKCLENRVAVLENQNKTLIEELKSLKELYCQKEG